jgi:superfamily II DNA or RNA helicase
VALTITVDNRIRLSQKAIGLEALAELRKAHEYTNPELGKLRALGYGTWNVPPTIKTWGVDGDELTLPRGGMERVRRILKERSIAYKVIDNRSEGAPVSRALTYKGLPLRDHQKDMVRIGLAKEQAILRGATGSGKTIAAFALAAEIGLNTLIVLPNKGLFDQWSKWADRVMGIRGDALGVIGGGKKRLRTLTIAMQATLARGITEDIDDFFGAVIVDETQRAAADSLFRAVDAMRAKYRIGISASEKRKDRKEFLTYDLFGKVAYEATRDAMTAAGHIVDVEIRVVPTEFRAPWYGVENDGIDFNRLLSEMTEDDARNALVHRFADVELAKGEKVIILTHRREHARDLERRFIKSLGSHKQTGLLLGDGEPGDREEFERSCAGIETGKVVVGVGTYGALGYGIDLPAVSVGIATTPIATNPQNFNQVRGRLCRTSPGKKQGRLYVLVDFKVYGMKPLRNIIEWNRSVVVWGGAKWITGAEYLASRSLKRAAS